MKVSKVPHFAGAQSQVMPSRCAQCFARDAVSACQPGGSNAALHGDPRGPGWGRESYLAAASSGRFQDRTRWYHLPSLAGDLCACTPAL